MTCGVLWLTWLKQRATLRDGTLFGLFLILCFGFRFFIEFIKLPQSSLAAEGAPLLMGQWLSIPFVLVGLALLLRRSK